MSFPHPRGYVCARASRPLTIDGDLTKPEWSLAPWTDDFIDIEGDARPRPHFRTRAKMLWDDTYFYICAELSEPHVWGTITEHDAVIFQDNDFEVFLDPDGDCHDYGELELNALNTTWDLRLPKPYRAGGSAENSWEIDGMKSAVKVHGTLNDPSDIDASWTVELALPWKSLATLKGGSCPSVGRLWRVNFSRVEWDVDIVDGAYVKRPGLPERNWVWSPQHVIDMHRPEWWGYVQFEETQDVSFRPDPDFAEKAALLAQWQNATDEKALADDWEAIGEGWRVSADGRLSLCGGRSR